MILRTVTALSLLLASAMPVAVAAETSESAASSAAETTNPDDRIRCRRIAITGSLVKTEKVCKSVGEWRRLSERGNERARDYIGTGQVCAGGACGNGG